MYGALSSTRVWWVCVLCFFVGACSEPEDPNSLPVEQRLDIHISDAGDFVGNASLRVDQFQDDMTVAASVNLHGQPVGRPSGRLGYGIQIRSGERVDRLLRGEEVVDEEMGIAYSLPDGRVVIRSVTSLQIETSPGERVDLRLMLGPATGFHEKEPGDAGATAELEATAVLEAEGTWKSLTCNILEPATDVRYEADASVDASVVAYARQGDQDWSSEHCQNAAEKLGLNEAP